MFVKDSSKLSKKLVWVLAIQVAVALLFVSYYWQRSAGVQVRKTLRDGRLGPLPQSATDVKVHTWRGILAAEPTRYLRFSATRKEIEAFVKASPSIRDLPAELFDAGRMYLPRPEEIAPEAYDSGHEYFSPAHHGVSWYDPSIKVRGRIYEIPMGGAHILGYHTSGEVVIDDDKNVVHVRVILW